MSCAECRFWMKYANRKTLGQCKKRAPETAFATSGSFVFFSPVWSTAWPETESHQYCGEFEWRKK